MKQLLIILCVVRFSVKPIFAQDSVKTNPIIFAELYFGGAVAGLTGLETGGSLNYQFKNSLLTFRASNLSNLDINILAPIIPIPIITNRNYTNELDLLYGLRHIKSGYSVSFSVGVSYNYHVEKTYDNSYNLTKKSDSYAGLPFELNFKLFKKNKSRYRVYYVFPVGKPTGFGRSFGLKISGNASKYSYVAIGLVLGLGYHKHY
ncbi:hypothetical protein [Mucilaginibacter sp.]|uniref:hypothetical protein n=1 Tax=Mucilaginibacter sp. TaxID=1882438 RepID=UPI003B006DD9